MTNPSRIRAQTVDGVTTVRVAMSHPMETGRRRDASGRLVPAWHIQQVTATLNGTVVLTAEWGTAVSQNPYLQFVLRGAKPGDVVGIDWTDNRGETRSDQASVT
jgi:sulfur-oxidizing protein SoxZ